MYMFGYNNMTKVEGIMKLTHFYYIESIVDKRGNILTACGIHVSVKYDIDLVSPTCEVCKKLAEDYENLRIR